MCTADVEHRYGTVARASYTTAPSILGLSGSRWAVTSETSMDREMSAPRHLTAYVCCLPRNIDTNIPPPDRGKDCSSHVDFPRSLLGAFHDFDPLTNPKGRLQIPNAGYHLSFAAIGPSTRQLVPSGKFAACPLTVTLQRDGYEVGGNER